MVVLIVNIHLKINRIFSFFYVHPALQATIVNVRELKEYISNVDSNDTFIVQCFLTHFDLDGSLNPLITKRW